VRGGMIDAAMAASLLLAASDLPVEAQDLTIPKHTDTAKHSAAPPDESFNLGIANIAGRGALRAQSRTPLSEQEMFGLLLLISAHPQHDNWHF
jgi:hypothetical protein